MMYCEYCFRWLINMITGERLGCKHPPLKEDKEDD